MFAQEVALAMQEGAIGFEAGVALVQAAQRPGGGRPKGVKSLPYKCPVCGQRWAAPGECDGADVLHPPVAVVWFGRGVTLDRAVKALAKRWDAMEPAERAESQQRMTWMMMAAQRGRPKQAKQAKGSRPKAAQPAGLSEDKLMRLACDAMRSGWKSQKVRKSMTEASLVLKEEAELILQYRRSEDRDGLERVAQINGPRHKGRNYGYVQTPEHVVERSLALVPEPPQILWNVDVSGAVRSERPLLDAAAETAPAPKVRHRGRRKLAPLVATRTYELHNSAGKLRAKWEGGVSEPSTRQPIPDGGVPLTLAEEHQERLKARGPQTDLPRTQQMVLSAQYRHKFSAQGRRLRRINVVVLDRDNTRSFDRMVELSYASLRGEETFPKTAIPGGGGCQPDPRGDDEYTGNRACRVRTSRRLPRDPAEFWTRWFLVGRWQSVGRYGPALRPVEIIPALRPVVEEVETFDLDLVLEGKSGKGLFYALRWERETAVDHARLMEERLKGVLAKWRDAGRPLPVLTEPVEFLRPAGRNRWVRDDEIQAALHALYGRTVDEDTRLSPRAVPLADDWRVLDSATPLPGSDAWWDARFRAKAMQLPVIQPRIAGFLPDRTPGWNVLPIMSPPCGYVEFLSGED